MPDTTSDVSIANLALAEISAKAIVSLADDSPEARWCSRFFEQCRDQALRSHPWNFAVKRDALSRSATAPANEWAYAYALPPDFIRLLQVNSFKSTEPRRLYQVEAGFILTDEEEVSIRYVFRQTDATKYDPLFVEALALLLASKISKPITGNDGTSFLSRYEAIALPRARRADAGEDFAKVKDPMAESRLVNSRFVSDISA